MKRDKSFQTKVVIRRLPPTMTEEQFVEQISPLPDHDYMYFVKADMSLGSHAFSRVYVNFLMPEDIFVFKDKFDGYVFLDTKGNEYPAIVEFAPFQKIPKKRSKKRDAKCGTIESDPDYLKFLESLNNPDEVTLPSAEAYLEEIESREKELKANNGVPKVTTPLIEYLKARKIEQQKIREEKREERKRKELEKKRIREEEKRRRKAEKEKERIKEKSKDKECLSEKEITDDVEESPVSETMKSPELVVQVLKNPERSAEREKDQKEHPAPTKSKDFYSSSRINKEKDRQERPKREWESIRTKDRIERPKIQERMERVPFPRDKDRSRREKPDYKLYPSKKSDSEVSPRKPKDKVPDPQSTENKVKASDSKDAKDSKDVNTTTYNTQWSPKDKRDNSCPGNVETSGSKKENVEMSSRTSSKSVSGEEPVEINENSKSDSSGTDYKEQNKDPRVERRIRNKDRPSLEIYRPGMRRFSAQRSSPQTEISTSASNSSSPSPTPPLNTGVVKAQVKEVKVTG